MDKSLAARMKACRITVLRFVLASFVVSTVVTGSVDRAFPLDLDKNDVSEPPGRHLSVDMNGRFSTLYEPSGIAPLSGGRFLVVEDEPERALRLITTKLSTSDEISLEGESRLELPSSLDLRLTLGVLDDLEGAAHDRSQRFYLVSSHDDSAPHWRSKRQKLLRFTIQDGRMNDVARKLILRRDLLAFYPQLAKAAQDKRKKNAPALNIEALAYDRSRDVLLIGLRAPLLNGKSIIIRLLNPDAYLNDVEQPSLDDALWLVDFDKGGLRAMAYDDRTDQLLLVSRREDHEDDGDKLSRLSADGRDSAQRIDIGDQEDRLSRVEGLVSFEIDSLSDSGYLFVRDNGNAKQGRGADWFVLTRKQLGLD